MVRLANTYAININDSIGYFDVENLFSYVSDEKKTILKKYRFKDDMKRSLYADLLARWAISNRLSISNAKIGFYRNEYKKPYLAGYPSLYFNTSHSGSWCVCTIADSEVGVDVEQIKDIDLGIAKSFFSSDEYDYINSKQGIDRLNAFYDLWTLKESYIKYIGNGFKTALNSFSVKKQRNNINLTVNGEFDNLNFQQYYLNDHVVSVCSKDNWAENIKQVNLKTIMQQLEQSD